MRMREPETFDAFYARTVSSVTSQMHALAGGDPQADHAIREAYARAYQQWYEVSGYRDPEDWVLDTAREAFERRRAQPVGEPQAADSGTWPGMYRPRAGAVSRTPDPEAAVTGRGNGPTGRPEHPYQAGLYQSPPGQSAPAQPAPAQRTPALAAGATGAGTAWPTAAGAEPPWPMQPAPSGGDPGSAAGTFPGSRSWPGQTGGSRQLIAIVAVIALLVVGGVAYLAFGRGKASPPASSGPTAPVTKQSGPRMLPAGHTGTRAAVPWSIVASGWTLADFSTGQPSAGGEPTGGGTTTFLVDPEGGKYEIYQWPAGSNPQLLAWSGSTDSALFAGSGGYQLLTLHGLPGGGQVAPLTLPAGVAAAGFTRPDGLNILAVRQGPAFNKLQRYNLSGQFQETLATNVRRPVQGTLAGACASSVCGALSSPTGIMAVWGLRGDEMQLVSNAGGLIRRLHVPGSGNPPSCTPVSWWNQDTILADCSASGPVGLQLRLWLVPDDGAAATPLTLASGSPSGIGFFTGAWQAAGRVYATTTSGAQCSGAPSGPGGLAIMDVTQASSATQLTVPGSTGNYSDVVGSSDGRLLVLAQTSCPGSSSLLWLNPLTGATQPLLQATSSQAGVTAAVTWGLGPGATAG
jgi:hypothetical protein